MSKLKTIYKKEIMDVLRDKKTVLMMVVLPLILYPLLFFVVLQIMTMVMSDQETMTYKLAYDQSAEEFSYEFQDWVTGDSDLLDYSFQRIMTKNLEGDLKEEKIDAYLSLEEVEGQKRLTIHYLSAVTNSLNAANYLKEEIQAYRDQVAREKLDQMGLRAEVYLNPITADLKDSSSQESSVGNVLGGILPFLLIVSILMASMYPAIDTTAGEKERGTLETMLTLPVNNRDLIMGKFLSVATISVASVFFNLLSISGIVAFLYTTMASLTDKMEGFRLSSFLPAALISLVCIVAFALFMSAVVMCICAFAGSFKEANNYVMPLSLVVLFTAYIGFIPNVELTSTTALIPVANICLLMKNILVFKYDVALIAIALFSNLIYALLAVLFLSKIYNSEAILFGDGMSKVKLFERRINIKKGSMPSVQEGLLVVLLAVLLMVYLGSVLSIKYPVMALLVPQFFILVLPLLACFYIKGDFKKIFAFRKPGIRDCLASLCLLVGGFCLANLVGALMQKILGGESAALSQSYQTILQGRGFFMALILIALLPAVCEELMYRGYLLTACKQTMKPWGAAILVAAIFAISHMSLVNLLPTFILGLILTYVVQRTGSIFCSMVMHMINNGLAVVQIYYGDQITFLQEGEMTPVVIGFMALLAVVFIPLGVLILKGKKVKN
ncbi:MAG: ABC transporter permease [Eubacterium sp.]|nr:ABC transporter permease [Eubacterium sp.]